MELTSAQMNSFYDEIFQQPQALHNLVDAYRRPEVRENLATISAPVAPILTGMGASYHAALITHMHLLRLGGSGVEVSDSGIQGRPHQLRCTGGQDAHADHRDPDAGLPEGAVDKGLPAPVDALLRPGGGDAGDPGHPRSRRPDKTSSRNKFFPHQIHPGKKEMPPLEPFGS